MTHATRPSMQNRLDRIADHLNPNRIQETTQPASSFEYFGSRAGQAANHLGTQLQNVFDRLVHVAYAVGNTAGAICYGLRQEVPFERWFFDHGFQTPLDKPVDQIKARAWAIVATCESLIRTTAEAVSYVFSLVLEPTKTHRHLEVLKAQGRSLGLSALAIVSPNWAKRKAYNVGGDSLIGASLLHWRWGSLYTGKRDAPFWKVECRCYPWIELPGTP